MLAADPKREVEKVMTDLRHAEQLRSEARGKARDTIRGLADLGVSKAVLARWAGVNVNTIKTWCKPPA